MDVAKAPVTALDAAAQPMMGIPRRKSATQKPAFNYSAAGIPLSPAPRNARSTPAT
ncbi:hypothetical protein [Pseudarthrobacter sp. S9]|uniref:hypothetical protein n=1 Tax=Pseudarthrobacter sp. S9 TaxID=3418421 RepID=UPI003CFC218D